LIQLEEQTRDALLENVGTIIGFGSGRQTRKPWKRIYSLICFS
jgi:hypothetical protein